ncbi:divergent polysaccharide deacetylase family protein [Tardiphaga sp. vice352]|uniref:divergent polysaccharide deacetylase family protein n=1 Tax=unclassified Tardiphaga TaxID=2631404 RepID=UPI00116228A8|nr:MULTISPECIES: divergent polysaccharide deacetylase family protein [unclassified Tardiphaga]QDM14910.1 divergent polysaccharide deacetylase family protein [Tardiphaga sp. vice278]QDM20017.1 divergent polysaccharide deacetylase family protein [Tardiphaga sp. vice154]QDM25090.1 divergent polysaccharide deacetylase family protein [Tardiphaga sp. vice304]QDM30301.1 divergent polysaccharide deacetylase family protein [Tardiphaga sp. vice352]
MSSDDLSAPLGQTEPRKRRFRLPVSPPQAIAAVLGVVLLGFLGFAIFGNDPMGGEPVARIALKPPAPSEEKPPVEVKRGPAKAAEKAPEVGGQKTITIIDGSSGARRDVVVSSDGAENASEPAGSAAVPVMAGSNPKLLEKARYGMVPIAADGMKPVSAYAAGSDAERARAMKIPSIAIVIGGLGVGAAKTTEAIMKLPAAVTLAFTPYGSDPGKLVERARAQRHEVLLQVPMEPFDYPDNDPGPQTLLATASAEQNLDRLLWHMSRFQGYVGLANFMGARFVAADSAMQPVLRDAAKRGLAYFDDGTAPRSVGQAVAEGTAVPFARADLGIDTSPTSADIDKALARLESLARERGYAVGTASALPISIERIAAWAKTLESRGVMLVPLTTAMLKSKSS